MESANSDDRILQDFREMYRGPQNSDVEQSAIFAEVYFCFLEAYIYAVVLTPVCDIYQAKADFIILVGLMSAKSIFRTWLTKQKNPPTEKQIAGVDTLSEGKRPESFHKGFMKDLIGHKEIRYHFLPAYKDAFPHSFADFQLVQSIEVAKLKECEKVATLNSPWKEALSQRYSAYCGRVGTRPYSDELNEAIMPTISNLKPKAQ